MNFNAIFIAVTDDLRLIQTDLRPLRRYHAVTIVPHRLHGMNDLLVFFLHLCHVLKRREQLIFILNRLIHHFTQHLIIVIVSDLHPDPYTTIS